MQKTGYLIIGSGIAGLAAAHLLREKGEVTVITKGKLQEANTYWAQGGIAAVMDKDDTFESHIKDTLVAGARHNDEKAVRYLVENGPKAIRFLQDVGVQFEKEPALEGGHSRVRVWHTSDMTGRDILNALIKTVRKDKGVEIQEDTEAVELIVHENRCRGVFVRRGEKPPEPLFADTVVLATGGLGQLFGRTTNTLGSGGDGVALALRAGLDSKDLEFVQFHPTAFANPDGGRYFLLSETLRGFGAKILNTKGEPFLHQFHPKAELAPRDIVSRAVFFELMNGPVFLSLRHCDPGDIRERFPNILKRLKGYGFDLTSDPIPITPVAHYACGGVPTDLRGRTAMAGLAAIGETACTGVHGANRLASNSLLEAVVFARAFAESAAAPEPVPDNIPFKIPEITVEDIAKVKVYAKRLGEIMWENAGIVRTAEGLREAKEKIAALPVADFRVQQRRSVCYKIIEACLARPESLGCHYIQQ